MKRMRSQPEPSRGLVSRRNILRGAAGAFLAIPFLPSLASRSARAQVAPAPLRFVFAGGRFGRRIDEWYPAAEPSAVEDGVHYAALRDVRDGEGHLSRIFGAEWDELHDKVSIVRGLDGMQLAGDAHGPALPLSGSGSLPGRAGFGYTIDVVMEESRTIYPEAPFAGAIRSCPAEQYRHDFSITSANGVQQRIDAYPHPFDIYARLFHPDTRAALARRSEAQRPVLNAVMEDYRAVMGSTRISEDDRYKLEAHVSMMSDIERRLGISIAACPGALEPPVASSAEVLHETTMDLEIAALACGLTRIVTHGIVQHDSNIVGDEEQAHSAAHNGWSGNGMSDPNSVAQWTHNRWSMGMVARFLKKLDAARDSEGRSLLDNTIFLYSNCESRGSHAFYDMPVVVAGSPDKLRLGYYIDYRPRPLREHRPGVFPGRPYNDVLVTVLHAMGLTPEEYRRFERPGFGVYDGHDLALADHYAPYLMTPDAPLPFLYRG